MPDNKHHWETVYNTKSSDAVSWYQAHADRSLQLIQATGLGPQAKVIDVGGGASTLVDDLLTHGYQDVTVMDLSASALAVARARQAPMEARVQWLVADVTTAELPVHAFDVWHDRAVFHFLTRAEDRQAYVAQVLRSVKPGGHVIVATFADDGPLQCSGLPVMRYAPEGLHAEFGEPFTLVAHQREAHTTPFGTVQQFVYCYCRAPGH
ncbi:MAG: methyltransferase [Curvibacter sp. RIFCSPHIGHO2_12_FULL_63_18]|uniref:class I SAM-dependent methyltransferase n=1 Tax=Rhodoferax sp. TaxID=50421 RepID=UPI0008B5C90C|nr:class I SAM-dependent methyltransferase [Rhodoferax sp.]OGO96170.1 MAG: methyltransferase [Curvibacter sp. GWA2_63_95]OGP06458.1 MAG: methyltransferase [Curvibacter sp. RIFCSPHIGHO2_12_FULL_63_18]HCX81967.1 SAM-dependent methyltransferase [Rhodoferax sp.]